MSEGPNLEQWIPMKPVDFLVLLVLAGGARHGYGIVREVEKESEGKVSLEPGNLYRTIRRLRGWGVLDETEAPAESDSEDERRRYYCLTELGGRLLAVETRRLKKVLRYADRLRLSEKEV